MKKNITNILLACAVAFSAVLSAAAQDKSGSGLEFDKTIHNFGDILHKSGSVSCTFTLTNKGNQPAVIYNVISSCGCTDVEWTREPLKPGDKGRISVTYSNDEGAYPFDKTLTVYTSASKKPVLLKVRGVSIEKKKPLKELYPIHYGPLAVKERIYRCGNLEQGGKKSETAMVANISSAPIRISFDNVEKNLDITLSPNPIPAGGTAELSFTVTADRTIWGKHIYYASPLVDGRPVTDSQGNGRIGFQAFTKEDFSHLTQEEKANGPRPSFNESTFSFGKMKKGEKVHAQFTFKNEGRSPFRVYSVSSDGPVLSHDPIPATAPGGKTTFKVTLDTSALPIGEHLTIVTLTTNSPLRPIVNLFIAGYIE